MTKSYLGSWLHCYVVSDRSEGLQAQISDRESDIVKLKGEKVVLAELVFIGTTSLYNVGSSQYNRLRLPKGCWGGE